MKKPAKQNPQNDIPKKLDILIRLFALSLIKTYETRQEQIKILLEAGFKPKQIAEILGTTSNTVRVAIHRIKYKRRRKIEKEGQADVPD